MTNNDDLALKLKAAADSATPGEWRYLKTTPFMDAEISAQNNTRVINLLAGDVTEANSEFIATANPSNILALLAERDADKKRIAELEREKETMTAAALAMRDDMRDARSLLEARTVSFKLPPCVDDLHGIGLVMSADAVTEALTAAGIKLEVGE